LRNQEYEEKRMRGMVLAVLGMNWVVMERASREHDRWLQWDDRNPWRSFGSLSLS